LARAIASRIAGSTKRPLNFASRIRATSSCGGELVAEVDEQAVDRRDRDATLVGDVAGIEAARRVDSNARAAREHRSQPFAFT
jgi:hypothetical protein